MRLGSIGAGEALRRLPHASQALLVVQELADEREQALDVLVLEDDGRSVPFKVTGVDPLVTPGVAVWHKDRR